MLISDTIGGENKAGHHMILDVDIENSAMLNGLLVDVNTPGYLCGESALTNWQEALSELFEPHRNRSTNEPRTSMNLFFRFQGVSENPIQDDPR